MRLPCLTELIIICVGLALLVLFAWGAVLDHGKLMKQCMDDGKKEYECRVLLDKPSRSHWDDN